jgi:UDP-N-acetylglucosamine transferase subunit ALG13
MIFVTIGTSEPFDRLLNAVDELATDELIVAQVGRSRMWPRRAQCHEFLSFDEVDEFIRRARVVVAHAGVGSVLTAARAGHIPIVATRLRRYGEAVDDHQVPFARRLAANGVVRWVEDLAHLAEAVVHAPRTEPVARGPSALAVDLRGYLSAILGDSGVRPGPET